MRRLRSNSLSSNNQINIKYRFVFPFLKDRSIRDRCIQRQERLSALLTKSGDIISFVQRSEQVDRDIEFIDGSDNVSLKTALNKLAAAIKENDSIKTDLVGLVMPPELKYYQDTFLEALSERGRFLSLTEDFMNSTLNALVKRDMAVETYRWSTSYWEIEMASDYAAEAVEYLDLALSQVEDAKRH